jgi:hypothetical protein
MKKFILLLVLGLSINWTAVAQTPVPTINGTPPPFTFTGSVTQTGQNFNFTGTGTGATLPFPGIVYGSSASAGTVATGHQLLAPLACADSSSSGTVQSCTTSPTFVPAANDCVIYTTTTANTGTGLTLNVNSLGAKSVAKWLGLTTLTAGDVAAGEAQLACYNGTVWNLSTIGNAPSGGAQVYPGTGIAYTSNGSSWGTSLTKYGSAVGLATSTDPGVTAEVPMVADGTHGQKPSAGGALGTGAFAAAYVLPITDSTSTTSSTTAASATAVKAAYDLANGKGTGNTTSTSLTTGYLPKASGANGIINSAIDDGITTAATITSTEPIVAPSFATPQLTVPDAQQFRPGSGASNPSYYRGDSGPVAPATEAYYCAWPDAVPTAGQVRTCGVPTGSPLTAPGAWVTPLTTVPAVAVPTPGTSITLAVPSGFAICTGTCTVSVPVPAAGYQFCILNDDNVSTAITLSALGSSARYENSARTAYGTAGTGTLVVSAAAGDMVCIVGRDSTHYLTTTSSGAVTVN